VIGEVAAVAGAAGARVEPARILAMFDRVPAGMKSSMQRDAEANRPTELGRDRRCGPACRAPARRRTALTSRLVDELRARETSPTSR
jgi:2-dehydropantoate 2-reductase